MMTFILFLVIQTLFTLPSTTEGQVIIIQRKTGTKTDVEPAKEAQIALFQLKSKAKPAILRSTQEPPKSDSSGVLIPGPPPRKTDEVDISNIAQAASKGNKKAPNVFENDEKRAEKKEDQIEESVENNPQSKAYDNLICHRSNPCPCKMMDRIIERDGEKIEFTNYECVNPGPYPGGYRCVQLKADRSFCQNYTGHRLNKTYVVEVKYGCELRYDAWDRRVESQQKFDGKLQQYSLRYYLRQLHQHYRNNPHHNNNLHHNQKNPYRSHRNHHHHHHHHHHRNNGLHLMKKQNEEKYR